MEPSRQLSLFNPDIPYSLYSRQHPGYVHIPEEYYHQEYGRQLAFPGMEQTPHETAQVSHPLVASSSLFIGGSGDTHSLMFQHHDGGISRLSWHADEDGGYRPGEIGMIEVHYPMRRQGIASLLMATATKVAAEHGLASPRHSSARTAAGLDWSQAYEERTGGRVV